MTDNQHEPIEIINAIDASRKKAATRALDVSLNELADMYKNNELVVSPEYQRYFRWSTEKQSQFIETLLLEMPVPPVFAVEIREGQWELVDGLQRISSYLHFRGVLRAPDLTEPINEGDKLTLTGCDIVRELNGLRFDDLAAALQIRLKRAFLRVELVRSGSDKLLRYRMFKRLNTGGEVLSEQEVRNCTIRILGEDFVKFIGELSEHTSFRTCVATLTDDARNKRKEEELVLRFFAFKNDFSEFEHDIGPFLTRYMEKVTDKSMRFNTEAEGGCFDQVFSLLAEALGDDAFRARRRGAFVGGFSMHHFESLAVGMALAQGSLRTGTEYVSKLKSALLGAKDDETFRALTTGGGQDNPSKYKAKIDFIRSAVECIS